MMKGKTMKMAVTMTMTVMMAKPKLQATNALGTKWQSVTGKLRQVRKQNTEFLKGSAWKNTHKNTKPKWNQIICSKIRFERFRCPSGSVCTIFCSKKRFQLFRCPSASPEFGASLLPMRYFRCWYIIGNLQNITLRIFSTKGVLLKYLDQFPSMIISTKGALVVITV